ncbi:uncharacterized protein L969DRAFT_165002 [Mixia osmundae IAM 14324]|uniref:Uncharacterized protein n=1 Tax=Mixia osmundae (strain CBS 9802 / IAM 14324 / JCM 22182 / KY 12970) TaxID=764103 RepID=G7E576_MIXOS|nr:uncharacterized protein L969DRAFT_165002 [Mixia osmundae IAM 14324]KEI42657.1 hypothetical protein L969DRAFT_165002 [Mixia osmundae IAM 14324]GAA97986.1 hypothetical protein E5Q_04666 [Mixia osmundae IAM 14324]
MADSWADLQSDLPSPTFNSAHETAVSDAHRIVEHEGQPSQELLQLPPDHCHATPRLASPIRGELLLTPEAGQKDGQAESVPMSASYRTFRIKSASGSSSSVSSIELLSKVDTPTLQCSLKRTHSSDSLPTDEPSTTAPKKRRRSSHGRTNPRRRCRRSPSAKPVFTAPPPVPPLPVNHSAKSHTSLASQPVLNERQLKVLHQIHQPTSLALSRHASQEGMVALEHDALCVPALRPPISQQSLKELDLASLLANPQLRHDLAHTPVIHFRPNTEGPSNFKRREACAMYNLAVAREIISGCRCTTFICEADSSSVLTCFCRSNVGMLASGNLSVRLPSRIPHLVEELKSLLLALLPDCKDQSSARNIRDSLDTSLVTQQADHRTFDLARFARFVGSVLLMHAAPIRDARITQMMDLLSEPTLASIATGLQACFDTVELMRLDVANYQLKKLRPYLLITSPESELHWFRSSYALTCKAHLSTTRALIDQATVDSLDKSIGYGLVDIVLEPRTAQGDSKVPETFRLDLDRLKSVHQSITELIVFHLFGLYAKQLFGQRKKTLPSELGHRLACIVQGTCSNGRASVSDTVWRRIVLANVAEEIASHFSDAERVADIAKGWANNNIMPSSRLWNLVEQHLRTILRAHIDDESLTLLRGTPWWLREGEQLCTPTTSSHTALLSSAGLLQQQATIQTIATSLARIITYHVHVYRALYIDLLS